MVSGLTFAYADQMTHTTDAELFRHDMRSASRERRKIAPEEPLMNEWIDDPGPYVNLTDHSADELELEEVPVEIA